MDKFMKQVEKMDSDELEKLRKLLNEKAKREDLEDGNQDAGGKAMTWMYKEDKPDRDEYLLGRRVDRHIEDEDKVPEDKDAPGASFSEVIARRADMDMHAKMREDPLYAIRKQEEESRKKLLTNPIKMKQLEKLIKEKEKRSKKKEKKKKKRRDVSSDDSGDELLNKYLEIRRQKELKALRRSGEYVEEQPRDGDKRKHKNHKHDKETDQHKPHSNDKHTDQKHRHSDHKPERRRTSSHTDNESDKSKSHVHSSRYGLVSRDGRPVKSHHRSRERSRDRSRDRTPPRKTSHSTRRSRSRSRSPRRSKVDHKSSKRSHSPPKKLSKEDMARKRAEMMESARWRDEQREANVKRYKKEAEKEKDDYEKQGRAEDFLNPLLMKHADHASVEERIKRNKYNVQRTKADLDKNFTKR